MVPEPAAVARALLVSVITAATACGGAEIVDTTPDVPTASGSVKVVRPQRDRLTLDIFVEQLAPPDEVKQGGTAYVVWAKPAGGGPSRNVGALAFDAGAGALRTSAAAQDMSLIITAEPSAYASTPSGETVLWAYVDVDEAAASPPVKPAVQRASAAKAPPPKTELAPTCETEPGP